MNNLRIVRFPPSRKPGPFFAASVILVALLDSFLVVPLTRSQTVKGSALASSERSATAARAGARYPSFRQPIIRANIRLPKARTLTYLKLRLIRKKPGLAWPDFSCSHQRVLSKSPESLILEIGRPDIPADSAIPVVPDDSNREYLAANDFIQPETPEVRDLASRIVGGETDAFRAGLKLEGWISDNLKIDRGMALVPSTAVLKGGRSTCLGCAVLLAAMARAAGIPSRVALGYAYASGAFFGHAWVEILSGESWVPLDAALIAEGTADAARIRTCASSLSSGAPSFSDFIGNRIIGGLDIKILEFGSRGEKRIAVAPEAAGFSVSEEFYRNSWLGISLKKPVDWRFTKLNPLWPDPAVVGLSGPEGVRVEIRQHDINPWWTDQNAADEIFNELGIWEGAERVERRGIQGFLAGGTWKAALVLIDRPEAWVFVAEGREPVRLLDIATAGLQLRRR